MNDVLKFASGVLFACIFVSIAHVASGCGNAPPPDLQPEPWDASALAAPPMSLDTRDIIGALEMTTLGDASTEHDPDCKAERRYPGGSQQTTGGDVVFVDRDGHRHFHDPCPETTQWTCSEGHAWTTTIIDPCPWEDFPE